MNLGVTSFYDGAPPLGPGIYYNSYTEIYSASRFNDNRGAKLQLPKQDVLSIANLQQIFYYSDYKIGTASLAFQGLIATVPSLTAADGIGNTALSARSGIGDLFFGPSLQFDPITNPDGTPRVIQRLEAQFIAPTGEYNRSVAINPGSNFWSFNPYYAATYFLSPELSSSVRLHYLYNFKNNDPQLSFGPNVRSTQAGQAFHGNFTLEYRVSSDFIVGFNSYYFQQFTNTKVDGIAVPGRKERVLGVGPGVIYEINRTSALFINAYYESLARNRPEGQRYVVRYSAYF